MTQQLTTETVKAADIRPGDSLILPDVGQHHLTLVISVVPYDIESLSDPAGVPITMVTMTLLTPFEGLLRLNVNVVGKWTRLVR